MKSLKFLVVALVVGFVLCAIAVAGVATYIVTSGPINLPGMPVSVATTPEAVKDLMNSGKPVKCTFETSDTEIGDQQWVLYKDDERIRGDSVVIDNDDATQTIHLINDGDYTYTWGDYKGQLVGTKYKLTEEDKINANASMEVLQNGELEDLLPEDYISTRCEIWVVDQEVFMPPSDVEFKDMNAQLEDMTHKSGIDVGDMDDICGMCEQAGDAESIEQCKEALSC